jgi:hypothetical protein
MDTPTKESTRRLVLAMRPRVRGGDRGGYRIDAATARMSSGRVITNSPNRSG